MPRGLLSQAGTASASHPGRTGRVGDARQAGAAGSLTVVTRPTPGQEDNMGQGRVTQPRDPASFGEPALTARLCVW